MVEEELPTEQLTFTRFILSLCQPRLVVNKSIERTISNPRNLMTDIGNFHGDWNEVFVVNLNSQISNLLRSAS